jgi:hypothetical protein
VKEEGKSCELEMSSLVDDMCRHNIDQREMKSAEEKKSEDYIISRADHEYVKEKKKKKSEK